MNGQVEVGSPWSAGNVCRLDAVVNARQAPIVRLSTQIAPRGEGKMTAQLLAGDTRHVTHPATSKSRAELVRWDHAADALLAIALLPGPLWRN